MQTEKERNIVMAYEHLKRARDLLIKAGCEQSLKKVRSSLKSVEGALRNRRAQDRREAWREERAGSKLVLGTVGGSFQVVMHAGITEWCR